MVTSNLDNELNAGGKRAARVVQRFLAEETPNPAEGEFIGRFLERRRDIRHRTLTIGVAGAAILLSLVALASNLRVWLQDLGGKSLDADLAVDIAMWVFAALAALLLVLSFFAGRGAHKDDAILTKVQYAVLKAKPPADATSTRFNKWLRERFAS